MKIKNYLNFINEISGTELVGHMGPNYPDSSIPNTIDSGDTSVLYSPIDSKIYTYDDYQTIYQDYLKLMNLIAFMNQLKLNLKISQMMVMDYNAYKYQA